MNWKQLISNLDKKENFELAIDAILKKVSSGIRGYSVKEMQNLGKIAVLLNKYNKLKFHDDKIGFLNNQLVLEFKFVLQDNTTADGLKDILAYYPIPVLDGIIENFPKSTVLSKTRNLLSLADRIKEEFEVMSQIRTDGIKSNKELVARADMNKLDQDMKVADELNVKIKQIGINSLEKVLVKINEKELELEAKMEEITERLGPFINSNYSKDDIREWLKDISDEGLVSLDGIDVEDSVEAIQEYSKLHSIKGKEEEDVSEKTKVVKDAGSFKYDIDEVENGIQKVIPTDVKKIKKQFTKFSAAAEKKQNDDFEITEIPEESINAKELKQEDNIVNPIISEHYDQNEVISKLKGGSKKGTSI
ncbi:MAG: hypothetical protein WCH76_00735 [Candidatus Riflemargulisbacteria bacterium]